MRKIVLQVIFLIIADCLALILSYLLSIYLADLIAPQYLHHFNSQHLFIIKIINILILFVLFANKELYTKRKPFNIILKNIIQIILTIILLDAFAIAIANNSQLISYWTIGGYWLISIPAIIILRYYSINMMINLKIWQRPAYVITDNSNNINNIQTLCNHNKLLGYQIIGVIDITNNKEMSSLSQCDFFHEIIIYLNTDNTIKYMQNIFLLHKQFISVTIIPAFSSLALYNIEIHHFFGNNNLLIRMHNQLNKKINYIIKTIFDYSVVLICMPIVLPVIASLTLLIMIENKNFSSPFFLQNRLGKNGKLFKIIKLKTMVNNAEDILQQWQAENSPIYQLYVNSNFKLKNDPRITKVGKFLRKTSLDELTQIFNVLTGSMSLVGPRPLIPSEVTAYGTAITYYKTVKPGITGLWQISGRNNTTFYERTQLDTNYITNWSLWSDAVILFMTATVLYI